MMDAGSYLHWLRTTELDIAKLSDLKEAVGIVAEALRAEGAKDEEPMLEALLKISGELDSGYTPVELIESFRADLFEDYAADAPAVVLEAELREIAAGIAEEQWNTESYQEFSEAVTVFLEGGSEEPLWAVVEKMDEILEQSRQRYCATDVLPKEITTESAVAHKILLDGIANWVEALEQVRDGDPDWDEVLAYAETGNRLLVAVQIFNQRLQNAVKA